MAVGGSSLGTVGSGGARRWPAALGIGVVVVLLLAGVVAPGLIGFGLERAFDEALSKAAASSESSVRVTGALERGWFTSTAHTRIELVGDGSVVPVALDLEHSIAHGLVPVGRVAWAALPLIAVVETRYVPAADSWPGVAAALEGHALVTATTRVHFDRSLLASLFVPQLVLDDGTLTWQGMTGEVEVEANAESGLGRVELRFGPLEDRDPTGRISVSGAVFHLESDRMGGQGADAGLGAADMRLDIGTIRFEGTESKTTIAPTVVRASGEIGADRPVGGTVALDLGDVVVESPTSAGAPTLVVRGLQLVEKHSLGTAPDVTKLELRADVAHIERADGRYGPGYAEVLLPHVRVEALTALRDAMAEIDARQLGEEEDGMARLSAFSEHVPNVLQGASELLVSDAKLTGPSGDATLRAKLGVDSSMPEMLGNPLMLMTMLSAESELVAPAPMFEAALDAYLRTQMGDQVQGLSEADIAMQLEMFRSMMLAELVGSGRLVQDGDRYRVRARFEQGLPYLNDQMIDPSFLSSLLPGM